MPAAPEPEAGVVDQELVIEDPPGRRSGRVVSQMFTVASDDETGVVVGRWGDLRIFTCPDDYRHAFQVDLH